MPTTIHLNDGTEYKDVICGKNNGDLWFYLSGDPKKVVNDFLDPEKTQVIHRTDVHGREETQQEYTGFTQFKTINMDDIETKRFSIRMVQRIAE